MVFAGHGRHKSSHDREALGRGMNVASEPFRVASNIGYQFGGLMMGEWDHMIHGTQLENDPSMVTSSRGYNKNFNVPKVNFATSLSQVLSKALHAGPHWTSFFLQRLFYSDVLKVSSLMDHWGLRVMKFKGFEPDGPLRYMKVILGFGKLPVLWSYVNPHLVSSTVIKKLRLSRSHAVVTMHARVWHKNQIRLMPIAY